jgi:hypothetical protein
MNIHSYIFEYSTPLSYSSYTQYISAVKPPRIIHDVFPGTHVCSVKEADNSAIFDAGEIINCETYHNSLCRDKIKQKVTSCMMVYKAVSHMTLPRMRQLSSAPSLFAQNKRKLLSE